MNASIILIILSAFILFLIAYLLFLKTDASQFIETQKVTIADSSVFAKNFQLIKAIQEEKQNSRAFVIQISQMVLLNLLLPILTAILGYIFASNRNDNRV